MGHRHDAIDALRAYARDLEDLAAGPNASAGSPYQDDAYDATNSGAPHPKVLTVVASVVLIGAVALGGLIAVTGQASDGPGSATLAKDSEIAAQHALLVEASQGDAVTAVRAFHALGMNATAELVQTAESAGRFNDADVQSAYQAVIEVADRSLTELGTITEADLEVAAAVQNLAAIVRPPGLDPNRLPPGQGGTPPGQDPNFTPPGQDPSFVPPGTDPGFTPPGKTDDQSPSKDKGQGS